MDIAFLRHEGGRQRILGFRNRLHLNRFWNNQVRSIYVMVYNVDSRENKCRLCHKANCLPTRPPFVEYKQIQPLTCWRRLYVHVVSSYSVMPRRHLTHQYQPDVGIDPSQGF